MSEREDELNTHQANAWAAASDQDNRDDFTFLRARRGQIDGDISTIPSYNQEVNAQQGSQLHVQPGIQPQLQPPRYSHSSEYSVPAYTRNYLETEDSVPHLPEQINLLAQPQAAYLPPAPKRRGPGWIALFFSCLLTAALTLGCTWIILGAGVIYDYSLEDTSTSGGTAPILTPTDTKDSATDWQQVAKNVRPAVVAIQVGNDSAVEEGSGVIFDKQGHVLTNHHVIAQALNGGKIVLSLTDGRLFRAKVVGSDPTTDLAVLAIVDPPKNMVIAQLGTSANLQVGQPVAAIGNPLGLSSTMTTGIISALDRPVSVTQEAITPTSQGEPVVTNAIQIDASINPGNSGGPLFNAQGQVIGINSSIISLSKSKSTAGSIGLGFAIPIDMAKMIAKQLTDKGAAIHAFLGVSLVQGSAIADGATRTGAEIKRVVPGSAAANAGLRVGDVVVAIDGHSVGSGPALTGYIRRYPVGAKVKIAFIRDNSAKAVIATLGKAPADK